MSLFTADAMVLDNTCGTGVVAQVILSNVTASIYCVDRASAMVSLARNVVEGSPHGASIRYEVSNGEELSPLPWNYFKHSITSLGIFIFTDSVKGAQSIYRTLKPEDTAIVTS